jgi:rhamnosyltransferase subunit B
VTGLGHRALVLTGPTPSPVELPDDPRVFSAPFAPLSNVASRSLAAIHHGGVGTTVELLSAGVPQLVVPRAFDQPQTAIRVRRLGVARTLPWARATAERLARELGALLADGGYGDAAVAVRDRLAKEDGLRNAITAVDSALRS